MMFNELQRIKIMRERIEELVLQRNIVTKVLTSKTNYIYTNNVEKDRSYEVFPGIFVHIYHIKFEEHIQKRYGLDKVEFGTVEERKGE